MERNKIKSGCNFIKLKDNRLVQKCKKCNDISYKPINDLITKCPNTYRLSNKDPDKFILLLRKGVYPYEYMDSWERFDKDTLPPKKEFYSNLNLEDITDKDYKHTQKVWNTLNIKNLDEYHDTFVQSDTLQLADIFEKFLETCIKIYQLDPAHFLSAPELAWQVCLKKTNIRLELLKDIDMLLMIKAGIRGGLSQAINKYAKANNKYMKNYNKNIASSYLMYLDANNLYGRAMCKKLPVSNFKWSDDLSVYTENFIKDYDEHSDKGCILEVDMKYPNHLWHFIKTYYFQPKEKNK